MANGCAAEDSRRKQAEKTPGQANAVRELNAI